MDEGGAGEDRMGRSGRFGLVVSVRAGQGEEVRKDLTGLKTISVDFEVRVN
jgi:hypothetical protein